MSRMDPVTSFLSLSQTFRGMYQRSSLHHELFTTRRRDGSEYEGVHGCVYKDPHNWVERNDISLWNSDPLTISFHQINRIRRRPTCSYGSRRLSEDYSEVLRKWTSSSVPLGHTVYHSFPRSRSLHHGLRRIVSLERTWLSHSWTSNGPSPMVR